MVYILELAGEQGRIWAKTQLSTPLQRAQLEQERANGFIPDSNITKSCIFDISHAVGDMLSTENEIFAWIKSELGTIERFQYTVDELSAYFTHGDFSLNYVIKILGKHGAQYGTDGPGSSVSYRCNTLPQIAFILVFHLVSNQYRFVYCKHCGKLFATRASHINYCKRGSPYPGYERYDCALASKRIVEKLEKRRKLLYRRQYARAEDRFYSPERQNLDEFKQICDEFRERIRNGASVGDLQEYEAYLYGGNNLPELNSPIRIG